MHTSCKIVLVPSISVERQEGKRGHIETCTFMHMPLQECPNHIGHFGGLGSQSHIIAHCSC